MNYKTGRYGMGFLNSLAVFFLCIMFIGTDVYGLPAESDKAPPEVIDAIEAGQPRTL
ncbi:MAG: hypothetical protein L0922_06715 [Candidatus Mariimomonas ferrooxydans]